MRLDHVLKYSNIVDRINGGASQLNLQFDLLNLFFFPISMIPIVKLQTTISIVSIHNLTYC